MSKKSSTGIGGKRQSDEDSSALSDVPTTSCGMQALLESQRQRSEMLRRNFALTDQNIALTDKVIALSEENNKLKEEVVSLQVTITAHQKEIIELKAQKSSNPGGKLPQLASMKAPDGEAIAKKTSHISNEDRVHFIRYVDMFHQQFPEATVKSIISQLVRRMTPEWSGISDATVARWRSEASSGVVRFSRKDSAPDKESS